MAPIEPKLVELVLAMAKIRRYLTVSETLGLANDLIKDSPLGKKSFNGRRCHFTWISRKEIKF